MKRHKLPNTDLEISALCCGGVSLGTTLRGEAMDRLLDAFLDLGGNFFDTAHCYSFWLDGGTAASEIAIGDFVRRRPGKGLIVATKGGHSSEPRYRTVDRHLAPGRIAADLDDSLARLGVEAIDLYWLHRDDPREPVASVVETLNAEVKRGRVRYLGASNWSSRRIAEANTYAAAHGLRGFVASQPEWSLGVPNGRTNSTLTFFGDADEAWSRREGFPIIPYTSTAGGYFGNGGKTAGFDNATSRARLARVQKLAGELGKSPNQVALASLMSHDFPVIPILGTTNVEHLRDAAGAVGVKLSAEQQKWLAAG
jgi:aryl-alcohol dehydrogenase-like predicted oxidoreductase